LPATLEWLETHGVPVIGYQTDELPAFYARASGLKLSARADAPDAAAALLKTMWDLDFEGGAVIGVPCPASAAQPLEAMERAIEQALADAGAQGVRGSQVTPFLLRRVAELTGGHSLEANLALLTNNAQVAGEIAVALSRIMHS
jgi:pseudouridine-5'-phosphate glycosidase